MLLTLGTPTAADEGFGEGLQELFLCWVYEMPWRSPKAQRRIQQERKHEERQQSQQDVQPRLPADGADLAPRTQQNGVHTRRFSRAPGNNVSLF
ncbi:hypothetical protein F3Y22_tig00110156pilonHSYRG00574 [Hibiscus syriacus]|uniref:Uncharacterized protein n=1 Tax=Hibiscus syriacus TaxID=106335 RepID=A0A6A3BME8_HIBSY|nr:hypothetical protein F3Y22_tig00110156pilonHSYRG00574 [Hibiscus syriacus]